MTITVKFNSNLLQSALLFAANKDIRYYLNGVYIDFKSNNFVATDGKCAYIGQPNSLEITGDVGDTEGIVMPSDFCKTLKSLYEIITIDGLKIESSSDKATAIEGKFPDYRRVYPKTIEPSIANLSVAFLQKCAKANRILGAKRNYDHLDLFQGGLSNSSVCQLHDNKAHVVIMPFKKQAVYSRYNFESMENNITNSLESTLDE